MNNGQDGQYPGRVNNQLVPTTGIITYEQFQQNEALIARAREQLAAMEHENQEAYKRGLQEEQELRNRIEAGRQAEAQLRALQSQRTQAPPIASSSTIQSPTAQYFSPNAAHRSASSTGGYVYGSTPSFQVQPQLVPQTVQAESTRSIAAGLRAQLAQSAVAPQGTRTTGSNAQPAARSFQAPAGPSSLPRTQPVPPTNTPSVPRTASPQQISEALAQHAKNVSEERLGVLRGIAKNIFETMRSVNPLISHAVATMVSEKLRLGWSSDQRVTIPSVSSNPQVVQDISAVGVYVFDKMRGLDATDVHHIMRAVQHSLAQQYAANAAVATSPGAAASSLTSGPTQPSHPMQASGFTQRPAPPPAQTQLSAQAIGQPAQVAYQAAARPSTPAQPIVPSPRTQTPVQQTMAPPPPPSSSKPPVEQPLPLLAVPQPIAAPANRPIHPPQPPPMQSRSSSSSSQIGATPYSTETQGFRAYHPGPHAPAPKKPTPKPVPRPKVATPPIPVPTPPQAQPQMPEETILVPTMPASSGFRPPNSHTLARDILRALGRPRAQTQTPVTLPEERKRKRTPTPSVVLDESGEKKQRTGDVHVEVLVGASEVPVSSGDVRALDGQAVSGAGGVVGMEASSQPASQPVVNLDVDGPQPAAPDGVQHLIVDRPEQSTPHDTDSAEEVAMMIDHSGPAPEPHPESEVAPEVEKPPSHVDIERQVEPGSDDIVEIKTPGAMQAEAEIAEEQLRSGMSSRMDNHEIIDGLGSSGVEVILSRPGSSSSSAAAPASDAHAHHDHDLFETFTAHHDHTPSPPPPLSVPLLSPIPQSLLHHRHPVIGQFHPEPGMQDQWAVLAHSGVGEESTVASTSTPVLQHPAVQVTREPLFYPDSPGRGSPPRDTSGYRDVDGDGDVHMTAESEDDFVPTGLLGFQHESPKKKGKRKALQGDDELEEEEDRRKAEKEEEEEESASEEIQIIEPEAAAKQQWKRRKHSSGSASGSGRTADKGKGRDMDVDRDRDEEGAEVVETSDVEEARALSRARPPRSRSRDTTPRRRREQAYVLVPAVSPAAKRINERELQKISDSEGRLAVYDSRQRLSEYRCPWKDCDAVLNNADKLGQHARLHAGENEEWNSFGCQWDKCTDIFSYKQKLAEHLRRHSFNSLVCAYAGCQRTFTSPKELARHHQTHAGDAKKPIAALITPQRTELPPLPEVLPSYMTVPRQISRARIPHDVHVWLGAKVAANITCYVHPGTRANAAVPSRLTRRVADEIAALEAKATAHGVDPSQAVRLMARDEYADWIEYDPKAPRFCDDLDSVGVTAMLSAGLVLGAPPRQGPAAVAEDEVKSEADQAPSQPLTLLAREDASGGLDGGDDEGSHGRIEHEGVASLRDRGPDDRDRQGLVAGDVQSLASTEEVAEMAQLLDDGPDGVDVLPDRRPANTSPSSNANMGAPTSAGRGASTSRMLSEPGWEVLPQ